MAIDALTELSPDLVFGRAEYEIVAADIVDNMFAKGSFEQADTVVGVIGIINFITWW